ncbi:DUF3240 family protein [Methylomonas sp. MgM2]
MHIFLRRIPANTSHIDITEFVSPVLNNGIFKKPSKIVSVEILALRDVRVDSIEYHGLVTLDSEAAVKQAVNGLRNRRLQGRYVVVRPYFHRNPNNDLRKLSFNRESEKGFIERRRGERRRGKYLEIVRNVSDQFNTEEDISNHATHQQIQVTFIVPARIELAVAECFVNFEIENAGSVNNLDEAVDYRITQFLTELEGPENKSRRFQIFTSRRVLSELLYKLQAEFSHGDIYYWVAPVIEFGNF